MILHSFNINISQSSRNVNFTDTTCKINTVHTYLEDNKYLVLTRSQLIDEKSTETYQTCFELFFKNEIKYQPRTQALYSALPHAFSTWYQWSQFTLNNKIDKTSMSAMTAGSLGTWVFNQKTKLDFNSSSSFQIEPRSLFPPLI